MNWLGGKECGNNTQQGILKNRYRYVDDYIEVKLQNDDLTMKCEVDHLPIIEQRLWYGHKSVGKHTFYVKCRPSKNKGYDAALFHSLAYPELEQVDHINHDGLDNRQSNIREGGGRVNANNKRMQTNNKSGVKGVYIEGGAKSRWCAQIPVGVGGRSRKKSFSIKMYGDEEAFRLACEYREQQIQEIYNNIGI